MLDASSYCDVWIWRGMWGQSLVTPMPDRATTVARLIETIETGSGWKWQQWGIFQGTRHEASQARHVNLSDGITCCGLCFVLYTNIHISLYPLTMFYPRNRETRRPTSFGRVPSSKRRRPVQGSLVVAEILVARCRNDTSDTKRTSKFFIKEIRRAQTWTDHSFRKEYVCAIHFFVLLQAMPHFVNRQQSCEGYAPSIKVLEEKRPQRGWEAEIDRLKDWKIKTSETAETSDTNKQHQKTCCSFVTLICCGEVTIKRPRRNESYNWRPG